MTENKGSSQPKKMVIMVGNPTQKKNRNVRERLLRLLAS